MAYVILGMAVPAMTKGIATILNREIPPPAIVLQSLLLAFWFWCLLMGRVEKYVAECEERCETKAERQCHQEREQEATKTVTEGIYCDNTEANDDENEVTTLKAEEDEPHTETSGDAPSDADPTGNVSETSEYVTESSGEESTTISEMDEVTTEYSEDMHTDSSIPDDDATEMEAVEVLLRTLKIHQRLTWLTPDRRVRFLQQLKHYWRMKLMQQPELAEHIIAESAVTSEDLPVDESETPEVTAAGDNVETTTHISPEKEFTTEGDDASSTESKENPHVFVEETRPTEQASMDGSELTTFAASVMEDASDEGYATDANDEETTPSLDVDGNDKEVKVEYTTTIIEEKLEGDAVTNVKSMEEARAESEIEPEAAVEYMADDEGQATHCPDATTTEDSHIVPAQPPVFGLKRGAIWYKSVDRPVTVTFRDSGQSANLPLDDPQFVNPPLDNSQFVNLPLDDSQFGNLPLEVSQLGSLPLDDLWFVNPPLDDSWFGNLPLDDAWFVNPPLDDSQSGNLPLGDSQFGKLPLDDSWFGNLPMDDTQFVNLPLDGSQFGSLPLDDPQFVTLPLDDAQFTNPPLDVSQFGDLPLDVSQFGVCCETQQRRPQRREQRASTNQLVLGGLSTSLLHPRPPKKTTSSTSQAPHALALTTASCHLSIRGDVVKLRGN